MFSFFVVSIELKEFHYSNNNNYYSNCLNLFNKNTFLKKNSIIYIFCLNTRKKKVVKKIYLYEIPNVKFKATFTIKLEVCTLYDHKKNKLNVTML